MMENLRWIMLAIGVAVILVIYLLGRRKRSEISDYREPVSADEIPGLSSVDHDDVNIINDDDISFVPSEINHFELNQKLVEEVTASVDDGLVDAITSGATAKSRQSSATSSASSIAEPEMHQSGQQNEVSSEHYDDDLIVLHVEARDAYFNGSELLKVINHQQLKFGDMNIYHAYDDTGSVLFSMSNMIKPGHFEPDHFADMRTPGVILFMQSALVKQADQAFDRLYHCADTLAKELDGQLTSASRMRLSETDIDAFRKKADYFANAAKV